MNALQKDIKDYGVWALACHCFAKVTGNREPYKDAQLAAIKKRNDVYAQTSEAFIPQLKRRWADYMGGGLDLEHPTGFDEKIQWLKIYDSVPLKTRCADKYLARDYVAERIGEERLVPLLGVWDSFDQIDFDALPQQFVLKTNHASQQIIVCKDKASFDRRKAKKSFDAWMSDCFSQVYTSCELHYRDIPRKIIAEQYLEQPGSSPDDYKLHCFGGKVAFIQAMRGRDVTAHITASHRFYDLDWKRLDITYTGHPTYEKEFERPKNLELMVHLAERLSEPFCYVRVDFYNLDGQILFGELTFTPDSGLQRWQPNGTNERLGTLLTLPTERYILPAVR